MCNGVAVKQFPHEVALVSVQRRQLLQLALIGVAAIFLTACRNGVPKELKQGDRFPDIALPSLDGYMTSFAAYPDVALVINFWATWCEPCRREMAGLEKLSKLFPPNELRVIGVSVDSDRNSASEFSLRYKLTIPMLSDSDQALSNGILRIPAFPITYLLRRDHNIARIIVGARDWVDSEMINEIEGLLAVRRNAATS